MNQNKKNSTSKQKNLNVIVEMRQVDVTISWMIKFMRGYFTL